MVPLKVYACLNRNSDVRMRSSSGAVFSSLAEYVFSKQGVVYGVAMSEDCYSAEFIAARDEEGLARLRGSKYLQAKLGDTFRKVKEDLLAGGIVLFSGTGCQVNGLKNFLGKDYDNLFCVDVVCHGVPSPKLWRKYVEYQESKYGKLTNVNFRCKDVSWINYGMKENAIYISKDEDSFMRMFLRDYCLRPSCYDCHAKNIKTSDITIADFWGIETVVPKLNDGKGTSLIITRTHKGERLFEAIKSELQWEAVSYEKAVKENPAEYTSVRKPIQRDMFFSDLNSMSFQEVEKKYAADIKLSIFRKALRKIRRKVLYEDNSDII